MKKERCREKEQGYVKILEKPGSLPPDAKVTNVISKGSDICGTSYSASKRYTKLSKTEKEERPPKKTHRLQTTRRPPQTNRIEKTYRILTMMGW